MKILHILTHGSDVLSEQIISAESETCEIKVIDLNSNDLSYESLVNDIFVYDRVISW